MSELKMVVINDKEMKIVIDVFEKLFFQLGEYFFTYYTSEPSEGVKKADQYRRTESGMY